MPIRIITIFALVAGAVAGMCFMGRVLGGDDADSDEKPDSDVSHERTR